MSPSQSGQRFLFPSLRARIAVIEETKRSAPFLPVTVRDQLSFDELARIAANTPNIHEESVERGLSRVYP